MATKILIAYRTKTVRNYTPEEALCLMPEKDRTPPGSMKNAETIARWKAEDLPKKVEAYLAGLANQPYTGTFDHVVLVDPKNQQKMEWLSKGRPLQAAAGTAKQPVSVAVCRYLLKHYPKAWEGDIGEGSNSEVIFVGFDVKLFLKLLGIECSLPAIAQPCPPKLWYGTSDHRDIVTAVVPDMCKGITLETALEFRRPLDEKAGAEWDAKLKGWQPHQDPNIDIWLTTELATQTGLLG